MEHRDTRRVILRKLSPREIRLVAIAGVALAAVAILRLRSTPGAPALLETREAEPAGEELPRIDLARLDAPAGETKAGQRDIFEFGRPPVIEPLPTPIPAPTAIVMTDLDPTPPPVAQLPALTVKFIGSIDNSRGVKVAVLLTDPQKEILTGQVGEVIANRYRISKIGLESVDLEDVTNGQTRRVALRSR